MNIDLSKKISFTSIAAFVYIIVPLKKVFAIDPAGTLSTPPDPAGTLSTPSTPAATLQNPLGGNIDSLPALVKELLNIVLIIGTPLVALAIIFAGFMLVAAQGNPEKLQKARSALLWAIVGGAVLLGSYILAQAIGGSVNELITP